MSYEIAKVIKKLRIERGISQEELAKNLGMTRQRYSRIESNQISITFKLIEKIAEYYKIPTNEITKVSQEKKSIEVLFRENLVFENSNEVIEKIKNILEYINAHEKLYYKMKEK